MRQTSIDESNFSRIRKSAPPIHASLDGKVTILEHRPQDHKYDGRRTSIDYTEGVGTIKFPFSYASAADCSPHYAIVDLWFWLHQYLDPPNKMFIRIVLWTMEILPEGVTAEDGVFTKLI